MRNSPSHQSRDSHDGVLKAVAPRPSEEDRDLAFSQKAKEAAADWQLFLNSSPITTSIVSRVSVTSRLSISPWNLMLILKKHLQHLCALFLRLIFLFCSFFFRQWREVSKGVYNHDVKEHLTDMCTDVLRFISESVAKPHLAP